MKAAGLCLMGLFLTAGIGPARAQLFVDVNGPRNIFSKDSSAPPQFVNFDSQKESLSLNFLELNPADLPRKVNFGGTLTATAPNNDVKPILHGHESPTVTGAVLVNYTDPVIYLPFDGAIHDVWSATLKISNAYGAYATEATPSSKTATSNINQPQTSLCTAVAFSDWGGSAEVNSLAFSFGVLRDTNYLSLPEVNTSNNGKTARVGTLTEFTSFPLQLLYVRDIEATNKVVLAIVNTVSKILWKQNGDRSWLLLSPYVNLTPREDGSPSRGFGFNLALRTQVTKDKVTPNKSSIPWSFYVESNRRFGLSSSTTSFGFSTIFSL
jgi:hypothetical protein